MVVFFRIFDKSIAWIRTIQQRLQILENWLLSKKRSPKTGLKDLSPTKLADKDRNYSNILKWALENKSIKNLALSGPYGSGKSSVVQTFQKRYPEYHYLNISLASFQKSNKKFEVELVLLSILQQIFYYVKSKSMPDSRFKRIDPLSKKEVATKSFILMIWGISLVYLLKRDIFKILPDFETIKINKWINYGVVSVFVIGALLILYYFLKLYNNSKLNKLNIASGELEIQPKGENSILNKHLDEILYFFEISRYDVVIIEDLDRFELKNTEIFTKLREINNLINNAQQIGRHVVFVYAIRDEVFKNEDRTKFFDFIIPVVPIVNSANSGDQFSIQLKEAGFLHLINLDFINNMADYITDMRMLINIVNEFLIYKKTIGDFQLEHNNLLGIIIYKNIEPDDFAELQQDKGVLYNFIAKRPEYNAPLIVDLNKQYTELEADINEIEDTLLVNIQELRSLYIYGLYSLLPTTVTGGVNLGNGYLSIKELTSDANFQLVQSATSLEYQVHTGGYSYPQSKNVGYSFSQVEAEIGHSLSYEKREKLLRVKAENRLDERKKELQGLQSKINKIRFAKIKDLAKISTLSDINNELKDKKLLVYLLENGYVDEHYRNYISYFYAENMTSSDRDFILAVNYNKPVDITFGLQKTSEILKRLTLEDFNKPQVLNIDLMDYILQNQNNYQDELRNIFAQLSVNNALAKTVREKYLEDGKSKDGFIYNLTKSWDRFWDYIQLESNYPIETVHSYLADILNFGDIEDIKKQNINGLLATYIGDLEDFNAFLVRLPNHAQINNILLALEVRFNFLSASTEDKQLFNFVHQNNLYKINERMVNEVVEFAATKRNRSFSDLENKHYTTIKEIGDEKILNYINTNIETYISDVFLKIESNTKESEQSVIDLLNNEEMSADCKGQIVVKEEQRIQALYQITDQEVWPMIVENNKMAPTWHNVTEYYRVLSEVDDKLANYLNLEENYILLEKELLENDTDIQPEDIGEFVDQILTSPLITDDTVEHLSKSFNFKFEEINVEGVSSRRVDYLISHGFLQMTANNYNLLKTSHNGKNIFLLEHFHSENPKLWKDYNFDGHDYELFFKSAIYSKEEKNDLANNMPLTILEEHNDVANILAGIYSKDLYEGTIELFDKIISKATNEADKVLMVVHQKPNFSKERYYDILSILGAQYSDIIEKNSYTLLENTPYNFEFATILDELDIISSISPNREHGIRLNKFAKKEE